MNCLIPDYETFRTFPKPQIPAFNFHSNYNWQLCLRKSKARRAVQAQFAFVGPFEDADVLVPALMYGNR